MDFMLMHSLHSVIRLGGIGAITLLVGAGIMAGAGITVGAGIVLTVVGDTILIMVATGVAGMVAVHGDIIIIIGVVVRVGEA